MRFDPKKSTLPSRLAASAQRALRQTARPARLLSCLAAGGIVVMGTVTMTTAPAAAQGQLTAGATDGSLTGDAGAANSGGAPSSAGASGSSHGAGASTAVPRMTAGASQPSAKEMNRAHDHVMGAGVRQGGGSKAPAAKPKPPKDAPKGHGKKKSGGKGGTVRGVDVSRWDSLNAGDWRSMAKQGIGFAYVKATEGKGFTSSSYAGQYRDYANAGLVRGAYHFALPNNSSGAKQAKYFVKHGGGWKADGKTLPPLLDMEYNPYGSTCYGLSKKKMTSWIRDFSNTVKKRTGRTPAIYTTRDWWQTCTGNTTKLSSSPLFIARYPKKFSDGPGKMPGGWKSYDFWQYTESGKPVPDMDVFKGSRADLRAFAKRKG